ncbi:MAG: helix-turn-helix domain-containing protein [Hyphomicrobium sp.]
MTEILVPYLMPPPRNRTSIQNKPKKLDPAAQAGKVVGENLREIRNLKNLSLDNLARLSGVSRAMLGQIENGKSIPTVTLLFKIANAVGVSVSHFVASLEVPCYQVERKNEARVQSSNSGNFQSRLISRQDDHSDDIFKEIKISSGHVQKIDGSRTLSPIRLLVSQGKLEITIGDKEAILLSEGDAIYFSAAQPYVLSNNGTKECVFYLLIEPTRSRKS